MLLRLIHPLLLAAYVALPPAALAWALWRSWRRKTARHLAAFLVMCLLGAMVGWLATRLNSAVLAQSMPPGQSLRLIYFTISAMLLLRVADVGLLRLAYLAAGIRANDSGHLPGGSHRRALGALLVQRVVLLSLAVPYVLAIMVTYRPKMSVPPLPDPSDGPSAEAVNFAATDGVPLRGWWMPAASMRRGEDETLLETWGRHTAIVCHGIASDKQNVAGLARFLSANGFNVLAFDFRGHGQSGGQLIGFGAIERRDVLGAVAWVRKHQPEVTRRLVGIGIDTGGAALLAAAVEEEGQSIDAVALLEPFADLKRVSDDVVTSAFPRWSRPVIGGLALPLASLHAGADLSAFSPAAMAWRLWPRPLLVIHGRGQTFVTGEQEMEFYRQASEPKRQFWPSPEYRARRAREAKLNGTGLYLKLLREYLGRDESIADDPGAREQALEFLRHARSVPVL